MVIVMIFVIVVAAIKVAVIIVAVTIATGSCALHTQSRKVEIALMMELSHHHQFMEYSFRLLEYVPSTSGALDEIVCQSTVANCNGSSILADRMGHPSKLGKHGQSKCTCAVNLNTLPVLQHLFSVILGSTSLNIVY